MPPFLLWRVVESDTSGAGVLDRRDAARAYVTDVDGSGLRALTPAGHHAKEFVYRQRGFTLLVSAIRDVDGNGQFTSGDDLTWYRYRAGTAGPAVPLVGAAAVEEAGRPLR